MPKISIIVPVYKVEPWLAQSVDSILGQTFTDFELILVDDGSPDKCPAICDEYAKKDSRVVVIHKENGGPADARNVGMEWAFAHSDSQYFAFIDDDDWVHPQYLEKLYNAIKINDADISIVYSESFFDGDEPVKEVTNAEPYVIDRWTACHRIDYGENGLCYATPWSKLYKKKLWTTIRFPLEWSYEDVFTIHRIIYSAESMAVVESPMYYYRLRNGSICRSSFDVKKMDRLYGYIARAEFYYDHGEEQLGYETAMLILKTSLEFYHIYLKKLHDTETAAKCKAIFNKYFDKERKKIKAKNYRKFWRFRYKTYNNLCRIVSGFHRIFRSLKVNGVYGSIKKCKEKVSSKRVR